MSNLMRKQKILDLDFIKSNKEKNVVTFFLLFSEHL